MSVWTGCLAESVEGTLSLMMHSLLLRFEATLMHFLAPPGGSVVKNPPARLETWVRSLGREDPLEKGMATHSRILAWRIPWTEEPGGLQSIGSQRVRHDRATHTLHLR